MTETEAAGVPAGVDGTRLYAVATTEKTHYIEATSLLAAVAMCQCNTDAEIIGATLSVMAEHR